jgi:hypothetical protein
MTRRWSLLLTSLALSACALAEDSTAWPRIRGGENILFIGNSLTSKLAETLNTLAEQNGLPPFNGHQIQIWNQTFRTHCTVSPETHAALYYAAGEERRGIHIKGENTLLGKGQYDTPEYRAAGWVMAEEALRKGTPAGQPWDIVVLQGYDAGKEDNSLAVGPDGRPVLNGDFMVYGARLIEAARAAGARPVLYMAWLLNPEIGGGNENPASYYNQNFDRLIANYQVLGKTYGIPVVPVGAAMRVLSKERKPAEARTAWLIRDNVHGTAAGAALLHYCMAGALYGKNPLDLHFSEKGYAVGTAEEKYGLLISPEIDTALRQTAADFLTDYGWQTTEPSRKNLVAPHDP